MKQHIRQRAESVRCFFIHSKKIKGSFRNGMSLSCLVGGGGFEPPKSLTTDLQSAKHSTFHVTILTHQSNIQEYQNKTQVNKKSCPVHVQILYHV